MKLDIKPSVLSYALRYLLLVAVVALSACADEDNLEQPTELTPFRTDKYLDVSWLASTGAGAEGEGGVAGDKPPSNLALIFI